eukprot:2264494-Prymnesium_polylepis.1
MGAGGVCACVCASVMLVCECVRVTRGVETDVEGVECGAARSSQGTAALPVQPRHRHARGAAQPPLSRRGPSRAPVPSSCRHAAGRP